VKEMEVVMRPDEILEKVRGLIGECAGDDSDRRFYVNRFVFARLQLDERKTKVAVKKKLIESGLKCAYCEKAFEEISGIHLHRVNGDRGYSDDNCALMHSDCHTKYHRENPSSQRNSTNKDEPAEAMAILKKESKRYEGKRFLYWWDISPGFLETIGRYEVVEFVKKDTREKCSLPVEALKGFLTEERQTTRGSGNWGIRIFAERGNELAFEPGRKEDKYLFLPVVWFDEERED